MKKLFTNILLLSLTMIAAAFPQIKAQTTISTGDMVITSKLMTFHNGIYVARGGIKAEQKDSTMTADRGIYDQELEVVKAIDNVKVTQPDTVLTADYLEAYPKEDRLLARGNPKVTRIIERNKNDSEGKGSKTRIILTCNEVESFNKEDRFLAKGNVKVIEVEYRESETEEEAAENEKKPITQITCEYMEMFSKEEKAICRNDVEIITETLTATGDKAIYLNLSSQVTIVGHAHAQQVSKEKGTNKNQTSELFANKILYYHDAYNKPPQNGLITHFKSIAEVTELPVVLYNVPSRTGCNLLPETVAELAQVKNICGIKEASGNLDQIQQIISMVPEDFSVFSGEDALNLPIMICGASGTISVTANVAPDLMKHFNDACKRNDWDKAKDIHYKLLPLHKAMFVETNPLPAKAALSEMGLISEHTRPPLCNADQKTHKLLKKIISSFGEMS